MAYVDAFFDRTADVIKVVERSKKGERVFKDIPIKYTFYYKDPKGKFQSIFGDPLNRVICKSTNDFRKEMAINAGKTLFESDMNPVYSALSEHYLNHEAPKLNVAFWDIETSFDPENGWSSPDDAFMPITAIAVHLQWLGTTVCLAVPPKTLTMEQAIEEVSEFPNTMLFKTEAELLDTFLDLIQDVDLLSGWNCSAYDVPFTVHRVAKALSKNDTRRFCLWDQLPKKREYEKYGKISSTYDFIGRVNIDSLDLYKKYTYEERHSYSLDAIAEYELGEKKTEYDGTLDQLYNNDFKTFIRYNRQDTDLLAKLDDKLKFIELMNVLAHENTVSLQATLGTVAATEQAIINEAHIRHLVVPNRKKNKDEGSKAAGAYVAYPKKGVHKWVGSLDINSLYPSTIRALNMSPETIVAQVRLVETEEYINNQMKKQASGKKGKSFAKAWEGIFNVLEYDYIMEKRIDKILWLDWEDGTSTDLSAAEIYALLFNSNYTLVMSANCTIFTYEKEGIISGSLSKWYAERQQLQKIYKSVSSLENGFSLDAELLEKIKSLL
jgi:DNA polymerase elongation subunit (family B)